MRAVAVVVAGVPSGHCPQVPFVVDQHPVGAFGSCGAYPPLGVAIGPWRLWRSLDYRHALVDEDFAERAGELGVAVPDEEAEGADPVCEVGEQVAGLRGGSGAVRVGGHAEDVHVPGRDLHDEQDVQALEEDRVDLEEVAGQQPLRLGAQERRQEVSISRGAGLRRWARKIRRTVASLTWCPSRVSSPCALRYPQAGFSWASRSTRSRICWLVPGRPGRFGYVHLRVIRRRCQASSGPGVTNR